MAAWLVTGDLPPRLSGAARNDLQLASRLAEHDVLPTLFGHPLAGAETPPAIDGVPIAWLPDPSRGLGKLRYPLAFLLLLARARPRPAIVRFRGFGLRRALCALGCRRFFPRVRVVIQPACFGVDDPRSLAASRWGRFKCREMLSADALLAMNPQLEACLRAAGVPRDRVAAVRNPVDLQRFSPAGETERGGLRRALGLDAGVRLAVTVGGLSLRKRQTWMTAAVVEEMQTDPALRLLLVGPGADDLRRLGSPPARVAEAWAVEREVRGIAAAAGMGERVRLTGLVADVAGWLRASDVFLQASTREGEANAVNEAMACALPCVIPQHGVYARQVAKQAAFIYAESDEPAFREAIRGVFRRPDEARRKGLEARRAVARSRSPVAVARDFAALLERLAAAPGRPPGAPSRMRSG